MEDEPKKTKCPPGAPLWMCTFADMMSLLLCFFVLLLSFSVMDKQHFQEMAGSMKDAFGVQKKWLVMSPPGAPEMISRNLQTVPFDVKREIIEAIEQEMAAGLIEMSEDTEGITLRVRDSVVFPSGEAKIRKDFYALLDKLGKVAVESNADLVVSGHTDNVPVKKGTGFESNWGLAAARGVAVVEYWQRKFKIPASRLSVVSFADGRPVASNDTAEGRAKNRRVEFRIRPHKTTPAFKGIKDVVQ